MGVDIVDPDSITEENPGRGLSEYFFLPKECQS